MYGQHGHDGNHGNALVTMVTHLLVSLHLSISNLDNTVSELPCLKDITDAI